jgi:hypothetical protein
MAIEGLFDHRIVGYRETPIRDELGGTRQVWMPVTGTNPSGDNAKVTERDLDTQPSGVGDQVTGDYTVSVLPAFETRERDLLNVISGPDSSVPDANGNTTTLKLLVRSVNVPRGHHKKVRATRYSQPVKLP